MSFETKLLNSDDFKILLEIKKFRFLDFQFIGFAQFHV